MENNTLHATKYQYSPVLPTKPSILQGLQNQLTFSCLRTQEFNSERNFYEAAAYTVRDNLVERWAKTTDSNGQKNPKRVYYLSLEFLMGRMLNNAVLNLDIKDELKQGLAALGGKLEEASEHEHDAALGNGGLGRLAACFLDSMATLDIPATGYGIRYEYGMFKQDIQSGKQMENPDNWLKYNHIWEFARREIVYPVKFYGKTARTLGSEKSEWIGAERVDAMAYDMPVPGYGTETVNSLRLWSAKAHKEFDLFHFNEGQYEKAVENKSNAESISKVLYPNDATDAGKELRLRQQYFFVSASIQDILHRYSMENNDWANLADKVAIQLNDTHPAIGVAEMMYQLHDLRNLPWTQAWALTKNIFAYTNHTLMPEALETWSTALFEKLLPRHLEIIYQINHEFLSMVSAKISGDDALLKRVSIIDEERGKRVRMAHLAVVGSHKVNGVAALHSDLLKQTLFSDFHAIYPEKFINVTNGITPRRWLNQANPGLTSLLEESIGHGFKSDLTELVKLEPFADDETFRAKFRAVKLANKQRLAHKIKEKTGIDLNPNALFDVQIKRIHEYKRQLLNVLHVITLYNRIRQGKANNHTPRAVIFGGKAAPGYWLAKKIIHLINDVATIVNSDPAVGEKLKVVFYPNYEVSAAEILFPGSDLSEQISTAGTEASGTGNMKMALNGALTIGTLDGANVEIKEEVGEDNIFIFGLTTPQVAETKAQGYNPFEYYHHNPELKEVIDMIKDGFFSPDEPDRYEAIYDTLLQKGDEYLLLADYASYVEKQEEVAQLYLNTDLWSRKAILNVARMGKFSSDRSIMEYARKIWGIK